MTQLPSMPADLPLLAMSRAQFKHLAFQYRDLVRDTAQPEAQRLGAISDEMMEHVPLGWTVRATKIDDAAAVLWMQVTAPDTPPWDFGVQFPPAAETQV